MIYMMQWFRIHTGAGARARAHTHTHTHTHLVYPSAWIVNVPIEDGNGESGTVSANNYVKGDSAVVSALPLESGKNIASQEKEYFQDLLTQQVPNPKP